MKPGTKFADLVQKFSDDPNRAQGGWIEGMTPQSPPKSLATILFALKPGQISPVIASPMGYHIFYREK